MALFRLLLVLACIVYLTFAKCGGNSDDYSDDNLPECEFDTEVQFYNIDIDVLELPELCTDFDLSSFRMLSTK